MYLNHGRKNFFCSWVHKQLLNFSRQKINQNIQNLSFLLCISNNKIYFFFVVEKLANKYAAHNIMAPMNVLWMHYFATDNTEEHERLWKTHVAATPRLMFQRIIHVAREQQNEQLIRNLIKKLKSISVTDGALGIAYSCLLDVLATKEQYDQGLVAVNDALKDVCLEHINRTALLRIKEGIERANKTFPHAIPEKTSTGVGKTNSGPGGAVDTTSSSSSSSSSSSDDEPEPIRTPKSNDKV